MLGGQASAAVVYSQHFNYPAGKDGNLNLGASGLPWSAYVGSSATNITNSGVSSGSTTHHVYIGPGNPNPSYSTTGGYLYTRADKSATSSSFAMMSEVMSSSANWTQTGLDAFVYANASHAQFDVHLLVQLGGRWYATTQKMQLAVGDQTKYLNSSSESNVAQHRQTMRLEADKSYWRHFNFIAGESMSLGATIENDLTGAITRVGIYTSQPALSGGLSIARFDAFTLSEVPEPTRWMLVMAGLVMMVGVRRKRV